MPRRLTVLALLLAGAFVFFATDLVAQPKSAPDLTGYRTVDTAIATRVHMASPGTAGQIGYLGVNVTADGQGKLAVTDIQPESAAAKAGLKIGDVVAKLEGQAVAKAETLRAMLQSKSPGDSVKLELLREGKPLEVTAKLNALSRPMKLTAQAATAQRPTLGLLIGSGKEGEGAPIEEVVSGSPAEKAKLKVGERLVKLDGVAIDGPIKLRDLLADKKVNDTVTLAVKSGDQTNEVKLQLAADRPPGGGGPGGGGGEGRPGGAGGGGRGGFFQAAAPTEPWKKNTYRLAVICLEFPDTKHNDKIAAKEWEEALFSKDSYAKKNNATGQPVFGSLNDYYREQSSGAFAITGKVFDWVEVGKKRGDYVQGSGTSNKTAPLVEALDKLTARDGKDCLKDFDGLCFVYAGEPVRGNRGSVYYPHAGGLLHQNKRWSYLLTPEGGSKMTTLNGFCREFGFLLGLVDLQARTENAGSEGAGVWCLMSDVLQRGRPQHLSAWSKERLGWLKPVVIDPTIKQKLVLAPVEESAKECFKVLVRPDGSEYFLLENRRKKGFDADLPAEGLLIWRVVNDRPVLEESHGVEGAAGPRVLLNSVPFPSPYNNAFTPETTPSSRSPHGGGLPVYITEIRNLADGRVTFQVGVEYQ
jgi:M6 family metalloprotease-like protein